MKLSDFDFNLPLELIAQTPAFKRDESRLMIVDRASGKIQTDTFTQLRFYLKSNTAITLNDTKVFPAKMFGKKINGKKPVEILLVRELKTNLWEALVKGLANTKIGIQLTFGEGKVTALLKEKREGRGIFEFSGVNDLKSELNQIAKTPLPPYIKRDQEKTFEMLDQDRYQTVFANCLGAIAAPTAGLHFTPELIKSLQQNGLEILFLTLHIGPGTFQPVRSNDITEHLMESEFYKISQRTWNRLAKIKETDKNILAVGTTTTRTLESIDLNSKAKSDISGWTNIFIHPGYRFKNVDQLLTNFHLPKSTLFMLVSAFGGIELMKTAYQTAIAKQFRFYSYGDAMLIL